MARLSNRPVVLRFVLGKGAQKARRDFQNSATLIARNVAIAAAEGQFELVRDQITERVHSDVQREINHLASMFGRFIIGAPGSRDRPNGTLDTVSKGEGAPTQNLANALPAWKRRSKNYLDRKRRITGGIGWFDNSQQRVDYYSRSSGRHIKRTTRPFDDDGGYMGAQLKDGAVWTSLFSGSDSGILVRFRRSPKSEGELFIGSSSTRSRITVGTLSVSTFNKVTTSMLHTNGGVTNQALRKLVAAKDPKLAWRLFGRRGSPYRPTLEPFLDFFLTRALPHAVRERLNRGLKQRTLLKNA